VNGETDNLHRDFQKTGHFLMSTQAARTRGQKNLSSIEEKPVVMYWAFPFGQYSGEANEVCENRAVKIRNNVKAFMTVCTLDSKTHPITLLKSQKVALQHYSMTLD